MQETMFPFFSSSGVSYKIEAHIWFNVVKTNNIVACRAGTTVGLFRPACESLLAVCIFLVCGSDLISTFDQYKNQPQLSTQEYAHLSFYQTKGSLKSQPNLYQDVLKGLWAKFKWVKIAMPDSEGCARKSFVWTGYKCLNFDNWWCTIVVSLQK